MKSRRRELISKQIPLITLIAVLLNLCVFTFQYASTRITCFVIFFNWLSPIGGIVLSFLFLVFLALFLVSVGWLIFELIAEIRQ